MDDLKKAHTGCRKHLQSQKENWELKPMKELRNALKNVNRTMNATCDRVKTSSDSREKYQHNSGFLFVFDWYMKYFQMKKIIFQVNMENRAPKEKHYYIAEIFCSFSILVSSV